MPETRQTAKSTHIARLVLPDACQYVGDQVNAADREPGQRGPRQDGDHRPVSGRDDVRKYGVGERGDYDRGAPADSHPRVQARRNRRALPRGQPHHARKDDDRERGRRVERNPADDLDHLIGGELVPARQHHAGDDEVKAGDDGGARLDADDPAGRAPQPAVEDRFPHPRLTPRPPRLDDVGPHVVNGDDEYQASAEGKSGNGTPRADPEFNERDAGAELDQHLGYSQVGDDIEPLGALKVPDRGGSDEYGDGASARHQRGHPIGVARDDDCAHQCRRRRLAEGHDACECQGPLPPLGIGPRYGYLPRQYPRGRRSGYGTENEEQGRHRGDDRVFASGQNPEQDQGERVIQQGYDAGARHHD